MKIKRAWKTNDGQGTEAETEISEERASMDLACAHGEQALDKLKKEKKLETRFGVYTITD